MLIELKNNLSELNLLNDAISNFNEKNSIPVAIAFKVNLAIEEIVTNIIKYGYDDPKNDTIIIDIQKINNVINITIKDYAKEFNPMDRDDPDTSIPLEKRKVGGLGIFFAKELMDSMEYLREMDSNVLKMRKIL